MKHETSPSKECPSDKATYFLVFEGEVFDFLEDVQPTRRSPAQTRVKYVFSRKTGIYDSSNIDYLSEQLGRRKELTNETAKSDSPSVSCGLLS